jgi:prolyl-tRNA synthetase
MTASERLYLQLQQACPIVSASIGTIGVSASVTFQPQATATAAQIAAAHNVIQTFDWSDTATQTYKDSLEPDLVALRNQAAAALAAINTYLAIPTPTLAQVTAEVKAIDLRQQQIIKALARVIQRTNL